MNNIVFDMGNVLTGCTLNEYISRHTENEQEAEFIRREVCNSEEWSLMDRGTMSDEEALNAFRSRLPEYMWEKTEAFIGNFRMEPDPNPSMEALTYRLNQAGYDLYLMSNVSSRFRKFSKNIASIANMKAIWISCEHGFLKPEQQAYENFLEVMGLKPDNCFFIDDSPVNVEAARSCGMRGCVYHQDVAELEQNLWEAGFVF